MVVGTTRELINGELHLGIKFAASESAHIKIRNATDFPHVSSGVDDLGWFGKVAANQKETAKLSVPFKGPDNASTKRYEIAPGKTTPIYLPSLMELDNPFSSADLLISNESACEISLYTSRRVSRDNLYRLATGTGVEIGPGPKPQIKNSPGVKVSYIEEKGAEDWLSTYKTGAHDSAWSTENYLIGKAHSLPVLDESLDFIFSSHVFEHLYNPLGHLSHWHTKLRAGGLVLGVIPCLGGTKDFVLPPTTLTELLAEQKTESFQTPTKAIENWLKHHQPHLENLDAAKERILAEGFSIHVHVYDSVLATTMFRYATEKLGYSNFRMHYKPNSKDFAFVLQK